jgi:hypothetical protein
MSDLVMRIESALSRAEAAAERLSQRHRGLRSVAGHALQDLDRLIETERRKANG